MKKFTIILLALITSVSFAAKYNMQWPRPAITSAPNVSTTFYSQTDQSSWDNVWIGYGTTTDGSGWTWVGAYWHSDTGIGKEVSNSFSISSAGKYYYASKWESEGSVYYGWNEPGQTDQTSLNAEYFWVITNGTSSGQLSADFSGTPTSGDVPLTVNFTDTSSTGIFSITSWNWTFGDTATSTSKNPSHQYTTPGTYDVRLIVGDGSSYSTNTKNSYIIVNNTNAPIAGNITIGQGPLLSPNQWWDGQYYYEEFMDWTGDDLRGLDPQGDASNVSPDDGYYWSRDLVAGYARLDENNLYFRADYFELGLNAEDGYLDTYILVDCATGGTYNFPDSV